MVSRRDINIRGGRAPGLKPLVLACCPQDQMERKSAPTCCLCSIYREEVTQTGPGAAAAVVSPSARQLGRETCARGAVRVAQTCEWSVSGQAYGASLALGSNNDLLWFWFG